MKSFKLCFVVCTFLAACSSPEAQKERIENQLRKKYGSEMPVSTYGVTQNIAGLQFVRSRGNREHLLHGKKFFCRGDISWRASGSRHSTDIERVTDYKSGSNVEDTLSVPFDAIGTAERWYLDGTPPDILAIRKQYGETAATQILCGVSDWLLRKFGSDHMPIVPIDIVLSENYEEIANEIGLPQYELFSKMPNATSKQEIVRLAMSLYIAVAGHQEKFLFPR